MKLQMKARADINARKAPQGVSMSMNPLPEGCSPLYAAAASNHLDLVKYLVAAGADKEQRDNSSGTALYIASYKGYTSIVKWLLQAKASLSPQPFENATPLLAAVERAHLDTLQVILAVPWQHET